MTSFHEVRFLDNIAYGATGGPEFATTVMVTGAGHEQRNVDWAEARGRWDVASGLEALMSIGPSRRATSAPTTAPGSSRPFPATCPPAPAKSGAQLLARNHFGSKTTHGFDDLSLSLSVRRWKPATSCATTAASGLMSPQRRSWRTPAFDPGDVEASDTTRGYALTREADGSTFARHAVGGGCASTKVFDGASDGGDTYNLNPARQGTVLVWVDGLLETNYSVAAPR